MWGKINEQKCCLLRTITFLNFGWQSSTCSRDWTGHLTDHDLISSFRYPVWSWRKKQQQILEETFSSSCFPLLHSGSVGVEDVQQFSSQPQYRFPLFRLLVLARVGRFTNKTAENVTEYTHSKSDTGKYWRIHCAPCNFQNKFSLLFFFVFFLISTSIWFSDWFCFAMFFFFWKVIWTESQFPFSRVDGELFVSHC